MKYIEEFIAGFALLSTSICIIINVFVRYVSRSALVWAEEFAVICFVWTVFIGSSVCYKKKMHIGIDIFIQSIPQKYSMYIVLAVDIFLVFINMFLTYLSTVFALSAYEKLTPILQWSYTVVDISAPIAFLFITIHSIRFVVQDFKKIRVH